MNETKVREQISKLVVEQQKKQVTRKQYPVAKNQTAKLTELGILHLMPEKFGYTDAAVVIEAATDEGKVVGGFNTYGEGDVTKMQPSALYLAINEADETTSDDDGEVVEYRDELDNLIDEVAAMENQRQLEQDAEAYAKIEARDFNNPANYVDEEVWS
jgi:hypothetical protein